MMKVKREREGGVVEVTDESRSGGPTPAFG